ncbi:peptidoglycan DD-metalloendopeptidase family protein [Halomonas sp. HL-93]|uniref:peptidoglycan DD-metalloendopeptidase family protein n=1 Tax=Halomonas sp. HL-93 TaxID=1666906 RepID=UPI0006DA1A8B|nr:peptidoglycan DD-metalloendopeptidase family protein [Halomonas sp. HL-93]KPQ20751.1 MAG: lipoprotein NlpD [Halomonas sp. HL-93]SBR46756.1 lipoprotein NlpD [Halomonas sp. HL-93]
MRKIVMMSALALAVAGCANQQGGGPQVRDLSDAREAVERTPEYQVKEGDTLYGIAWQHNLDYREVAALNNIEPPYRIQPGQTLALREGAESSPSSSSDTASSSDGSSGGAVARGLAPDASSSGGGDQEMDWLLPDETAIERNQRTAERDAVEASQEVAEAAPDDSREEVATAETASDVESAPEADPEPSQTEQTEAEPTPESEPEQEPEEAPEQDTAESDESAPDRDGRTYTPAETIDWQWPSEGKVVGEFGQGDSVTAGIDIAGEKGQPVRAAGPGIVVYAGSGVRGYGNLILLKHNDEFLSAYAHNDSLNVSENDVVEAGEVIASMGDSDAEDARLHFEVRREGQPQDPLEFLPSR